MSKFKSLKEIDNKYLRGAERGMGTSQYYHRLRKKSVYTDAVKDFMEVAEAQWFYDIIETEIYDALTERADPDKYYLYLTVEDNSAVITLKRYTEQIIHRKEIPFTDLPDGELMFYVAWNPWQMVTCMPIED